MRGTIGSVIVFDLADRDTINEAMDWHYQLSDNNRINDKYIQVLVGHQKDQYCSRQISFEEASEIAKERGMRYVELNAKDEFSVENLFMDMAYQTLEFYKNREY